MAHRSKKKHLKHVHQHEAAAPKAQPAAKAEAARPRAAKPRTTRRASTVERATKQAKGIVRSLASKATQRLTAKPRKVIARAKARVRSRVNSLLGKTA